MGRTSFVEKFKQDINMSPATMLAALKNAEKNTERFTALYNEVIKHPSIDTDLFIYLAEKSIETHHKAITIGAGLIDNPAIDLLLLTDPDFIPKCKQSELACYYFIYYGNLEQIKLFLEQLVATQVNKRLIYFMMCNDKLALAPEEDKLKFLDFVSNLFTTEYKWNGALLTSLLSGSNNIYEFHVRNYSEAWYLKLTDIFYALLQKDIKNNYKRILDDTTVE